MGGYYALLARQPDLLQAMQAGGLTKAQRDQREFQQQQLTRQDDQFKFQREQYLAEREADRAAAENKAKEAGATQLANRERYFARAYEANQGNPEMLARIDTAAQAQGVKVDRPISLNLSGGETYTEGQPSGDEIAMQLEGRASGRLGPPKPEEMQKPPTTGDITEFERTHSALQRGTPTYEVALTDWLTGQKQKSSPGGFKGSPTVVLREEWQGQQVYKDTQQIAAALSKAQSSSATPAGDMSLVFAYMKLLDPNSTVREGEYASAKDATGVPGQVLNMYNGALKGRILNDEQRANFMGEAGRLFGAQKSRYQSKAEQYRRLAAKAGADPNDVVLPDSFSRHGQGPSDAEIDALLDAGGP
jgi:hypothetical protein